MADIMREIDPAGAQRRRRRRLTRRKYYNYGPNYCWHVDGKFCLQKTAGGGGCHSFLYDISACQNSEILFLLLK